MIKISRTMTAKICLATGGCRIVKPFPKPVQQSWKSLYERGMIGWGRKHAAAVVIAMETTGLTENQVKVCLCIRKFTQLTGLVNCPSTLHSQLSVDLKADYNVNSMNKH